MWWRTSLLLTAMLVIPMNGSCEPGVSAIKDPKTSEVTLSNDRVCVRFEPGKPGQFGYFPYGYPGYKLELRTGDKWTTVARAPYFTAYCYRCGWGRDWLSYLLPTQVDIKQQDDAATVTLSGSQTDLDAVRWDFTFSFTLKPGKNTVDVTYTATPDKERPLLLFWGPRICVGDGTFGTAKDEAIFPGLEYLGPKDRSSANDALAPDARMYFVPKPSKITIPLMAVTHGGLMAGMMWDPLQKWNGSDIAPSALFASPNWIENKPNHLMGLFLPSCPDYVPENGLRASNPAIIKGGQTISVSAKLFAAQGRTGVDAVDLYLKEMGGLPKPEPPPMSYDDEVQMLVRSMVDSWDAEKKSWTWDYGAKAVESLRYMPLVALYEAIPVLKDRQLAERARAIADQALQAMDYKPLALAYRVGGLERALEAERQMAADQMKSQNKDGSWGWITHKAAEGGLRGLYAPPEPGVIGNVADRSQGITAGNLAPLMEYAYETGDEAALKASIRGLEDIDRYTIPFANQFWECPQSPTLHGAYHALRSFLMAYEITSEKRYLDRAVYWAKSGLPFIYLWSLPPIETKTGYIHCAEKIYRPGNELYKDTTRREMLYGSLYGYGSSQYTHHWFGILVQWIGLVYARDLTLLSRYDHSLPWKDVADGMVSSALWQAFDQPPYAGFWPDAFTIENATPSGPAFAAGRILPTVIAVHYGKDTAHFSSGRFFFGGLNTRILRDGDKRFHITSAADISAASVRSGIVTFALNDPDFTHCRASMSGVAESATITVDGKPLPKSEDLESMDECWSRTEAGLTLVKVRQAEQPRRVEVRG